MTRFNIRSTCLGTRRWHCVGRSVLQVRINGDVALLKGIMKAVLARESNSLRRFWIQIYSLDTRQD